MTEEATKPITESGLQRVREILFGGILAEVDKRLSRLESYITARTNDLQHDARQRMDVLETHLKKEVEVVATRAARDITDLNNVIRELRAQLAGIERETREQLLASTKNFLEELEQLRSRLRAEAAHEEEEGEHPEAEGTEHLAWDAH
jgi:hypothetical protein